MGSQKADWKGAWVVLAPSQRWRPVDKPIFFAGTANLFLRNAFWTFGSETRLTCLMWPNYPGTEFVGMALKFSKRKKNSASCVPVLQKTLKLVNSPCRVAEDGKEMYQNV